MEIDESETPMEVDEPEIPMEVDLDDNDRYLIHLLETNFEVMANFNIGQMWSVKTNFSSNFNISFCS